MTAIGHPRTGTVGGLDEAAGRFRETAHIVRDRAGTPTAVFGDVGDRREALLASLPPMYPEWLGDRDFGAAHGARFPYVVGEMANGIATTAMVVAAVQAGLVGVFGAAGLTPARVAAAVDELAARLPGRRNWGVNLIHSPSEPRVEEQVVDVLLARRVPVVSASAYLALTPAVVRCAARGLTQGPDGRVQRPVRLFAKVSRTEVGEQFMSPAPRAMLDELVASGRLTRDEAELAARVPVAEDVTAEADSGGHTDNRPLGALLPTLLALRDDVAARAGVPPVRVGAAGGLGTPQAVAAAFALGAAYVVTGSVNQSAVESGLSPAGKAMLATAGIADVVMAPAADMFEMGVRLQVLQRGSLFAGRATLLWEAYRNHAAFAEVPPALRARIERDVLREPFADAWAGARAYWAERDPTEVVKAERDAHHLMALVFRSYLGRATRWAITGDAERRTDYQIWCGPAMGAFNQWVRGSFLERPEARTVVQIALNLLEGSCVVTRAHQLRCFGLPATRSAFAYRPRPLA